MNTKEVLQGLIDRAELEGFGDGFKELIEGLSPKEREEYAENYLYFTKANEEAKRNLDKFLTGKEFEKFEENLREIKKEADLYFKNKILDLTLRLQASEDISLVEAQKLLTGADRDLYVLTLKEYINMAEKGILSLTEGQQRLLNLNGLRARVTRLEALQTQLDLYAGKMYHDILGEFNEFILNLAEERYLRSAFDMFKFQGIGTSLAQFSNRRLQTVIANPWAGDGKTIEDRLEQREEKLRTYIRQDLSRQVVTGESYQKIIEDISRYMDEDIKYVKKLVTTEAAFIASVSDQMVWDDLGVKKFQYVATLDDKTSVFCKEMDGKVFPMSMYQPGFTAPPLHSHCRSDTIPYTVGWENLPSYIPASRSARDGNGKTYYVPADLNYYDWREKYAA